MHIGATSPGFTEQRSAMRFGAEAVRMDRKRVQSGDPLSGSSQKKQVQPEELLQNIKALTEEGLYSVRFEMNKDTGILVINLVEKESGEVIRQIPPKEIIGLHKVLDELNGNIVETKS